MSKLRSRMERISRLKKSGNNSRLNNSDLFFAGALIGLYSKQLFVDQEQSPNIQNSRTNQKHSQLLDKKNETDTSLERTQSFATSDRLSASVSDYVSSFDSEAVTPFSKGFYTAQVDYIAKVFDESSNIQLAKFTKESLQKPNLVETTSTTLSELGENLENPESKPANEPETIKKASGDQSEPTYREIIEKFKGEMGEDQLIDVDSEIKEESEVIKTAKIESSLDANDSSNNTEDLEVKEKSSKSFENKDIPDVGNSKENIELADAGSSGAESSQSPPSTSGAEAGGGGAGAAGSTTSSVFGSIGIAPVAAAAGIGLVVSETVLSADDSSPLIPIADDVSTEEPEEETPLSPEVPVISIPEVVVTETSDEDPAPSEPAVAAAAVLSFQGRVVDGYVVGATVFYDANNNGILDDSESNYVGVTNSDGTFSLPDFSAADPGGSVVVLPGGIDTNTGHEIGAMQVSVPKDADGNAILSDATDPNAKTTISSPLTLILAQNTDIVEADLIVQLGMTGVEDTGLAYYDPVTEMQAGNNNSLAEYVFTVQQQLFSVIQAGSKIAGTASGLSALEVSVKAVGEAITTALENGQAITVSDIATTAITSVANASGFSSLAASFVTIVNAANSKIEAGYSGLASALSDPTNTDSIDLLSNARATAAASQDSLLTTISTSLSSGSLDVAQFSTDLDSVIAENAAVFGTVLQAEAGDGSSGLSEFGNPAFIVEKLLEQTGSADRDILDLSSSINSLSLQQLSDLGVKHVRLLGSNTSVEISLGNATSAILANLNDDASTDDVATTLVDEASVDDALFASNYSVTLKVTDTDVQTVVANATALNAAGIDIIKPVEGTLTLTLAQVQELNTLGFEFASGLVRFSAAASDNLTFDQIYTLLNAGLKLTDASTVTVSIPDGDSRSTFSTIKDLAASGVSFDGGTITLETTDVTGSFNVLQAQLLDAAKSNIVFDTSSLSGWSLGKASDGTSLGNPSIDASDVTYLLSAGITFNDATVNVTSANDVSTVANNAFDLLNAGVTKFNFSSGVSITTDNATLIMDAKDLMVAQGTSYSDTIFSGSGVLSELGSATLQSLSDYLAEGLGLDTSFVPEFSDALALVQLGITFPQGITIQGTEATSVTQSNAELMVDAGVSFFGDFNVIYSKDGSLTEAENLIKIKSLVQAGLTPTSSGGGLIQVSGTEASPLYLSPDEFSSLKDLVEFQNASLVLMRSSDFETAFGDLTTNQSYWESQTAFSKFAVPLSVTPPYSKFSSLASLNSTRQDGGLDSISIVRVSKSGSNFTELDTDISVRLSTASDLDTIDVSSLKSSGVDYVDVLGVPLSVSQIQRFQSNDAPVLQNGQLLISNANIDEAATLFTVSADRNIFAAGIESFSVASGSSATADVWKVFSDAYDTLSGDSDFLSKKIFDGGVITGSGSLSSGVGQVLDRLGRGGLVLSDDYSPSLTEVKEYIDGGGSYTKGIKISLQDGETLTPSEAISLAQANVSFTANTPLDFTGQTKNDLLGSVSESSHVVLFKKLLDQGFLMQNLSDDLLNLEQVTITPTDFETLKGSGFNFLNSKIEVTNKMELIAVSIDLVDETNHGISHIIIPSTLSPTFAQTKLILGSGVAFETKTDDSSGINIKVNSVGQLESLVSNLAGLDQMGVTTLDLEGLLIPWNISKLFAEAASSINITFTNEPGILIGSGDNLSEVAPLISQLYTLGARTVSFEDGIEIQAKAAHDVVLASDNITFASGAITNADEVADSELKSVLSSLKNKGLGVSSDFKPSVSIPLTDNSQADCEQISSMIRDGYRIKSFVDSDGQSHDEYQFSNVFLALKDYVRFSEAGNFDDEISAPTFVDSYVVAKNAQDLIKISSDMSSETSSISANNISNIALLNGISPSYDQLNQIISSGFSLTQVTSTDGLFSLSSSTGISLRPSSDQLSGIAENADGFFAAGITRLELYGKEIEVNDAKSLLAAGFEFGGGKIKASEISTENTLINLEPLAEAGLALPREISLMDSIVSLDFAINSFKGSLAGASIDLSEKQGSDSININQTMRLVNRELGEDLNNNPSAFLSVDSSLPISMMVSETDSVSGDMIEKAQNLGFNKLLGAINPSTAINLLSTDVELDISELGIKGDITVDQAVAIVDAGKQDMFQEIKIKDDSQLDVVSAKKILSIDSSTIDLNELAVSDAIINPQDFFEIQQDFVLPTNLIITGQIDSVEQASRLISLTSDVPNSSFVNLTLQSIDGVIESDASSIAHVVNNGIDVFDGSSPTVIITDTEISPQNAISLSRGFVDLTGKSIINGSSAQFDQIRELSNINGLLIEGVSVLRQDNLPIVSKSDVFSLANKGVVFNDPEGLSLYTLSDEEIGPIEAIELNTLAADLTDKPVVFDGYLPESLAVDLSSINGVDLSGIFVRAGSLNNAQIQDLEIKGSKINYIPNIIDKDSTFSSIVEELSDVDPRGQDLSIKTSGTVQIDDDRFSEYETIISTEAGQGIFDINFNQNVETGLHELNWSHEINAQEVEYLAENESIDLDYHVSIEESFFEFEPESTAEFDARVTIQGTDDQPVINYDNESDVSVLLRQGQDSTLPPASGVLNVEERDLSDTVIFSLKEVPQNISNAFDENADSISETYDDSSNNVVDVPMRFSLSDKSTNAVVWEFSPNNLDHVNEYISQEFSSGEYALEWVVNSDNEIYEQLNPGEILTSDWVFEVVDNNINLTNDSNNQPVTQTINIGFQANSVPQLIDGSTGLSPILEKEAVEDNKLLLNPDDFGYQYYFDSDQDAFNSIQISQFSEDVSLYLQPQGGSDQDIDIISAGEVVEIVVLGDSSFFSRNDEVLDLVFSPGENINGSRFVNFYVGDGIDFSNTNYELDVFVSPVVDSPFVTTSTTEIMSDNELTKNIKFVSDPSTVYFNIEAVGQNSQLTSASLEITKGDTLLDSKQFDEQFSTDYEYDLETLIGKYEFVSIDSLDDENLNYQVTTPVTAKIIIEATDQIEDVTVQDTFVLEEKITIIPNSNKIQQDKPYQDLIFGSSDLGTDPISNFSDSANSDDISFIDPTFEKVVSTNKELNGQEILFDAESILGTDGDDFIIADTSLEKENGTLIHGGSGFDDLTGSDFEDIIYIDHAGKSEIDIVSGGHGSDVFVISDEVDDVFNIDDNSAKLDLEQRLGVLLEQENISQNEIVLAGVIEDFSIADGEEDNLVLEGFSESSQHSVEVLDDMAVLLIKDEQEITQEGQEDVEKIYTAAILMPEYGAFDSSDMDLLNDSIHKM